MIANFAADFTRIFQSTLRATQLHYISVFRINNEWKTAITPEKFPRLDVLYVGALFRFKLARSVSCSNVSQRRKFDGSRLFVRDLIENAFDAYEAAGNGTKGVSWFSDFTLRDDVTYFVVINLESGRFRYVRSKFRIFQFIICPQSSYMF